MSTPKRIQRKRTKGWRMPEGAVYVGRGTKWGNPFRPEDFDEAGRAWAVAMFEETSSIAFRHAAAHLLRGKDLACWCPLDQPCHADALLEWANR